MHESIVGNYIPQLTICAGSLVPANQYRIVNSSVEFRSGTDTWRILTDDEVRKHFRLYAEVAAWLGREFRNAWVWS